MTTGSKRVLFISYLFPPVGGGGVQRSVKFAKYLPSAGWTPVVLTVKPISYYVYDATLLDEMPTTLHVERSGSLDPLRLSAILLGDARRSASKGQTSHPVYSSGSLMVKLYRRLRALLLFPDAQLAWIPFAYLKGLRMIHRLKPQVIYATISPFSSGVVAYLLSRRTGVPYVLDFRDGWTDDEYHSVPTRWHRKAHERLERVVVASAAGVAVYGNFLGERLSRRYGIAERVKEITNGFDPADLEQVTPTQRCGAQYRFVYSGTLFPHHAEAFCALLEGIQQLNPDHRAKIEFLFIGNVYQEALQEVQRRSLADTVSMLGYMPHSEAIAYLMSADASVLLVRAGDFASVTGKVFELLLANRPILAAVEPHGEAARILSQADAHRWIAHPSDSKEIARTIGEMIDAGFPRPPQQAASRFSRVEQAKQLAALLEQAHRHADAAVGVNAGPTS